MKVGIVSMQRIVNYGSFLQAYSLKNTIEKMGHEVEFVDYEIEPPVVPNPNKDYEPPKRKNVVQKAINYVWENRSPKSRKIRKYNRYLMNLGKDFRELYFPLLGIKEERNPRAKEDVIVIGSDEVFNCLQTNPDVQSLEIEEVLISNKISFFIISSRIELIVFSGISQLSKYLRGKSKWAMA